MKSISLDEAVLLAFACLLFVFVSSLSYEDEVADTNFYCEQVSANKWPDYKPENNCSKENHNGR